MRRAALLLLCCAAFATSARAQAPCCSVTAINAATGVVSAKVNANGETFQFKLTNANLLKELRVGEGVYANFTTHQVSLDGKTIAGPITSGPQTPAPVTAPKIAPPPASTSAPVTAPKIAPPPASTSVANPAPGPSAASPISVGGTVNPFQILSISVEVPLNSGGSYNVPPGSLPAVGTSGVANNYTVDVYMLNKSNTTLQNVPVQLSITLKPDLSIPLKANGPADTVTQVIPSWQPDASNMSQLAQFSWQPAPGIYTLTATIDPNNQIGESQVARASNSASIELTQPQPLPPVPAHMALNPSDAGPANSIFSYSIQNSGSGNCTGGLSPVSSSPPPSPDNGPGVILTLTLPSPLPSNFGGCTMNATLYKGVTLRNGWTVYAVEAWQVGGYSPNFPTFTFSPDPKQGAVSGSTSPEMHIQVSATHDSPYPANEYFEVGIQGPQGTSPFGSASTTASGKALLSPLVPAGVVASIIRGTNSVGSSSSAPTATGSASSGSTAPTGAKPALNPVCAGSSTLAGVDVSSFSGTVNWKQVQASGRTFAYAKATTGTNYTDPTFATNYAAIKAAGLHRGAYHTFDPTVDGTTQAQYFLSIIGTLQSGDLPPALDVEGLVSPNPDSVGGAVSVSVLQAGILQWMTKVQAATGRTPILYSSPAILQQALASGSSADLLWVSGYGVTCPLLPAGSHQWVFWQSSGSGKVPGISGAVDLGEFNGSLADLKVLTNP